jgi:hypothetical protein
MRKLFMLAIMALSFFAATSGTQAQDPFPECNPCPWVR